MILLSLFTCLGIILALVGAVILVFQRSRMKEAAFFCGALAAGLLLGVVFLDLLPEAYVLSSLSVYWLLGGVLLFYLIEQFLRPHRHQPEKRGHYHIVLPSTLGGLGLHNLIDGLVLGTSFATNPRLGILVGIAVVAHRFADGITNAAIMLHSGCSQKGILGWTLFLSALMLVASFISFYLLKEVPDLLLASLLGFSSGILLYVATSHLIPESREKPHPRNFILLLTGILIIAFLIRIFPRV